MMEFYVSPQGNDAWSGRLPTPNRTGTDGPLASLAGARDRLRRLRGRMLHRGSYEPPAGLCEPVTVWVRGGRYEVTEPVVFGPEDSYPVTYAAWRREQPVFDGGRRITEWQTTVVNGRRAWVAELPEVAEGKWYFRSLFVNGRRAPRARLPKRGWYRMEAVPGLKLPCGWTRGGHTAFVAGAGDIRPFTNLSDVEVVFLHFWIEERSPIASYDPATRVVRLARPTRAAPVASYGSRLADYYLDNVLEALSEPGEWYLDRGRGRLYYLPRPRERIETTEVYAPRVLQIVAVRGCPEERRWVEGIRFVGLTFRHTDWRYPDGDGAAVLGSSNPESPHSTLKRYGRGSSAAASQAACDVPGVITWEGTRHCGIEDCTIEHVGWYGLEIGDGCRHHRVVGNTLRDLGAGGVKINGASACDRKEERETGEIRITDNEISQGGRVFHSAVGVLSMHAFRMLIAHNHIHDFYYTGISCGWVWGYQENISRDNRIEKNHIHDLGHGWLSDLGGIYTLGVQPGTVIRANLIHDIRSAHYGGWCIYPDEGSSHLVIEENICYDADRHVFHQHYGRENLVRHNLFAFGAEGLIQYSRADNPNGLTFLSNVFLTNGRPVFCGGYDHRLSDRGFTSDLNLFWDLSGTPLFMLEKGGRKLTLAAWRRLGQDRHSIVADPRCRNLRKRDFRIPANSPALRIGYRVPDLHDVGPRPRCRRN